MNRPAMMTMQALVKFEELEATLEDYDFKIDVSPESICLIQGQDFMRLYATVEEFNAAAEVLVAIITGDIDLHFDTVNEADQEEPAPVLGPEDPGNACNFE